MFFFKYFVGAWQSRGAKPFIFTMDSNMCEEMNSLTHSLSSLSLSLSHTTHIHTHPHILQNFVYTFWGNKDISMPKDSTPKDSSRLGGNGGGDGELSMDDGGVADYPLIHFVQAKDWNFDVETRLKK